MELRVIALRDASYDNVRRIGTNALKDKDEIVRESVGQGSQKS